MYAGGQAAQSRVDGEAAGVLYYWGKGAGRLAAASGCRLNLPAAKGTRGACDARLIPALRGPGGSKWNRARPGPYPF